MFHLNERVHISWNWLLTLMSNTNNIAQTLRWLDFRGIWKTFFAGSVARYRFIRYPSIYHLLCVTCAKNQTSDFFFQDSGRVPFHEPVSQVAAKPTSVTDCGWYQTHDSFTNSAGERENVWLKWKICGHLNTQKMSNVERRTILTTIPSMRSSWASR